MTANHQERLKMSFIGAIVSGIARILHPEKPREWFENVRFPTDYTAQEVAARLDAAAEANPQFRNWAVSIVDLMKLSHPDNPDEASSLENRKQLAAELGNANYTGTGEENRWLHAEVFKAIQQRGIPLPAA
jgi:hypothetical protein